MLRAAQFSERTTARRGQAADDESQARGREDRATTPRKAATPRNSAASNEAEAYAEAWAAAEAAEDMPSLGQVHMYDRTERRFSGACP